MFNYITLRAVLATMTSLAICWTFGPLLIRKLTEYKIGQSVRDDGPKSHLTKAGTPTMGGALILISLGLTTLLWADLSNRYIWVVLIVTLGFGAVGWVDDWRKVVHRNPKGLSARAKFFWSSIFAAGAAVYLGLTPQVPAQLDLIVPFFKSVAYPLGAFGFMVLTYFVIVGTSHAVNLTDGLDGLATMPAVMVSGALAIFAYVAGNAVFSRYLGVPFIPGAGELAIFCGALCGAGLGFLWFNAYPAEVFMGDVGALALGAALGTVAEVDGPCVAPVHRANQGVVTVQHLHGVRAEDARLLGGVRRHAAGVAVEMILRHVEHGGGVGVQRKGGFELEAGQFEYPCVRHRACVEHAHQRVERRR